MRRLTISIFALMIFLCVSCEKKQNLIVESPNKTVQVQLQLDSNKILHYSVVMDGLELIKSSELGLRISGENLHSGMKLVHASKPKIYTDSYSMSHGKQANINYTANEQSFTLENNNKAQYVLRWRVSDNGVAFRYELPETDTAERVVEQELTEFAFPVTARAYLQHMAVAQTGWSNTNPSYEEHYTIDVPVGTNSPSEAGWVFPALFKNQGKWLLISETNITGDWHASRLQANPDGGVYKIGTPMAAEVIKTTGNEAPGALLANGHLPMNSPWRLIAIGDLSDIVASTLGTDLAAPAKFPAEPFKPGVVSWSWALLKDESVNYETTREFIDYAAAMQWEYTLIDADWDRRIGEEKIRELIAYATSKNVGLLLWYNSSGDWNITEYTPKSKLVNRDARRNEFKKLQDWGIKGVKIDFFPGDGQSVMRYYNDLIQDAADFGLMVNFHGSSLPRGLARTYPNMMTMEAVKGFEFITFVQDNADKAAQHVAMLPFTRNVFDPMDFTPTTFGEIPNIERKTTNGFEAALPVLFLSGLQHIAETPTNMANQPEWLQEYMRDLPVLWDESRLLNGDPGKFVVIARRKGERWYIAGINGENSARELHLNLDFLKNHSGRVIYDKSPREVDIENIIATDTTAVNLLPQGGFVMVFEKR